MTISDEYQNDINEGVRKDVERLREYEERIADLELELKMMKKERDDLRVSLLPYRIECMPLDNSIAQINNLPNEILCMVFEYTILDKHYSIRTLLLVCRQWHDLVMDSPKLWARIDIPDAISLFDLYAKKSLATYIEACYRNSGQAPMDVQLKLHDFPDKNDYIQEELVACAKLVFCDAKTRKLASEFDEIADQIYDMNITCESSTYDAHLDRVLLPLIGTNEENFRRWKSLTISLPKDYEDDDEAARFSHVWPTLSNAAPYLKEFHAEFRGGWLEQDEWDENPPIFSSVTSFSIPQPACPSFYQLSPSLLQHLAIPVQRGYSNLLEISRFSKLRTLKLGFDNWTRDMHPPKLTIRLPQLRKLKFISYRASALENVIFEVPLLENVGLTTRDVLTRLPQISPVGSISIKFDFLSISLYTYSQSFDQSFDVLSEMGHSSHTLEVQIPETFTEQLLNAIVKFRTQGKFQSLEHLYVRDIYSKVSRRTEIPIQSLLPLNE